jgi:hypothetical protein
MLCLFLNIHVVNSFMVISFDACKENWHDFIFFSWFHYWPFHNSCSLHSSGTVVSGKMMISWENWDVYIFEIRFETKIFASWTKATLLRIYFRNLSVQRFFLQYKSQCLEKVNVKYVIKNLQIFLFRIWFQKYTKQCRSVQWR